MTQCIVANCSLPHLESGRVFGTAMEPIETIDELAHTDLSVFINIELFKQFSVCDIIRHVQHHAFAAFTCDFTHFVKIELAQWSLPHIAAYCNTLQHTATHCNTLQRTATHCNALQHTVLIL